MNDASKSDREQTIFEQAMVLSIPGERKAFLRGACGNNAALRRRIEALLRAHEGAEDFLPDRLSPDERPSPHRSSDLRPSATVLVGTVTENTGDTIGRYKLLQKIGEGGCGVVYMAEQEEPVRRKVAL